MPAALMSRLDSVDSRSIPLWIYVILLVNLTFIVVTASHQYLYGTRLFTYLGLGAENNLAAWWSSMLLLLVGVLYYDTANKFPELKLPLWIIGLLMVALSVDEQGSLHERVFKDNWSVIIIVGLLGASVFGFAVLKLFAVPEWRTSAIIVTCGFACFSTVVLQEYFEHRLVFPEWATGIRTAVEESSELIGVFLCLYSVVRMRTAVLREWASTALISFKPLSGLVPLAILGLSLHGVASLVTASLDDLTTRGNPAMWFPTACFFLCAYIGARRLVLSSTWNVGATLFVLFCLALSAGHTLFLLPRHPHELLVGLSAIALLVIVAKSLTSRSGAGILVGSCVPLLMGCCWFFVTESQFAALFCSGAMAFAALLIYSRVPLTENQVTQAGKVPMHG